MNTRYSEIVNGLSYQGNTYTNEKDVNKIVRALSKEWNHVKPSIRKVSRTMPLTMDELMETLMAYDAGRRDEVIKNVRSQLL